MKCEKYVLALLLMFFQSACGEMPRLVHTQTVDEQGRAIREEDNAIQVSKIMDLADRYDDAYQQSMAVYGNTAFVFNTKGACRIVNLPTQTIIAETRLATYVPDNHANHVEFSHQFKAESSFPLLYVTPLYSRRCYVECYHPDNNTFTREQTILLSTTEFGDDKTAQYSIDRDRDLLYVISHKANREIHLRWFRLPDIGQKWVTLTDDDLLGTHKFELPEVNYGQGSYILGGKLYLLLGGTRTRHELFVIDLLTFAYKHYEFTALLTAEPEGIAPYKGYMIVNTNFPGAIWRLIKY